MQHNIVNAYWVLFFGFFEIFIMNCCSQTTVPVLRFGEKQVNNLYVHYGVPKRYRMRKQPGIDFGRRQ